jgi:uncharacterized ferredoxin-like protein
MGNGEDALGTVAGLMVLSVKTAPKAMGRDSVVAKVADGEEKERIAVGMGCCREPGWVRDAETVRKAGALVLVGIKAAETVSSRRGMVDVSSMDPQLRGDVPAMALIDLGVAVGSAVKTASIHNVDNRVMWRAGVIASSLGILDSPLVLAMPLSVSEKSIFFDR